MQKKQLICNILAIIAFIAAAIMIYQGFDKTNNYYSSENYPDLNINAYVGGDAYNYIINANYATGYYVLALIFIVSGFGLIFVGYLSQMTAILEDGNNNKNPKQFTDLPGL